MNRGLKYRIYPGKRQHIQIMKNVGCARFVYNHALDEKQAAYAKDKTSLSAYDLIKELPHMKEELPWLKEAESSSLQQAVRHLDAAYKNFFAKRGQSPKHKTRRRSRWSYTVINNHDNIRVLDESHIQLPKLGKVKTVMSRPVPESWKIRSATVSIEHDGSCYVSLLCEYRETLPGQDIDLNNAIGLDYKSDGFYVDSNGSSPGSPKYFRKSQKKLTHEQRGLRHKQKGSNNYKRQCKKISRVHIHIKNQRKDFLHKQSTAIAKQYDLVAAESLSNKGSHNGKPTMDNGYGMFLTMLGYKMPMYGHVFMKVDRFFPSSQLCHVCGYRDQDVKDLKIRAWSCPACGTSHDRDLNAAINIRNEGIRMYLNP